MRERFLNSWIIEGFLSENLQLCLLPTRILLHAGVQSQLRGRNRVEVMLGIKSTDLGVGSVDVSVLDGETSVRDSLSIRS